MKRSMAAYSDENIEIMVNRLRESSKKLMYWNFMDANESILASLRKKKKLFPDIDEEIKQAIMNSMLLTIKNLENKGEDIGIDAIRKKHGRLYNMADKLFAASHPRDAWCKFMEYAGYKDYCERAGNGGKNVTIDSERLIRVLEEGTKEDILDSKIEEAARYYFGSVDVALLILGKKERLDKQVDINFDTLKKSLGNVIRNLDDIQMYKIVDELIFRNIARQKSFKNEIIKDERLDKQGIYLDRYYATGLTKVPTCLKLYLNSGEKRDRLTQIIERCMAEDGKMLSSVEIGLVRNNMLDRYDSIVFSSKRRLYTSTSFYTRVENELLELGFYEVE